MTAGPFLLWAHPHEGLPVTLGDQRAVLFEGFVMKFHDAGARARFRFAFAHDLRRAMHGVTFE